MAARATLVLGERKRVFRPAFLAAGPTRLAGVKGRPAHARLWSAVDKNKERLREAWQEAVFYFVFRGLPIKVAAEPTFAAQASASR